MRCLGTAFNEPLIGVRLYVQEEVRQSKYNRDEVEANCKNLATAPRIRFKGEHSKPTDQMENVKLLYAEAGERSVFASHKLI